MEDSLNANYGIYLSINWPSHPPRDEMSSCHLPNPYIDKSLSICPTSPTPNISSCHPINKTRAEDGRVKPTNNSIKTMLSAES